jgi:hypothetical protein
MQPIRLTIYGDFWDSQIYKGRLYLWSMDNVLHVYNWDTLVESITRDGLRLPLVCAFSRGDLLYVPRELSTVFKDQDVRNLLKQKFDSVAQLEWSFSQLDIERFLMGKQDSPFNALHDDSSIYLNRLYGLTDSGLFTAKTHKRKRNKYKVDRTSEKLWDGIGTAIKAKSRALAVAAADDGLFELSITNPEQPKQISESHTVFVNWAFASVYGSSDTDSGHLVAYRWTEESNEAEDDFQFDEVLEPSEPTRVREFVRIIDEEEIFGPMNQTPNGARALSWGSQDKLYRATSYGIEAVHFIQQHVSDLSSNSKPFEPIGEISLRDAGLNSLSGAIAGSVAYFGVIVEYDDMLIVATSDDELHVIAEPITRWRVFPQSIRYENHLHLIFDDRVEIWSFNNDYFVNQREKRAGIEFTELEARRRRNLAQR